MPITRSLVPLKRRTDTLEARVYSPFAATAAHADPAEKLVLERFVRAVQLEGTSPARYYTVRTVRWGDASQPTYKYQILIYDDLLALVARWISATPPAGTGVVVLDLEAFVSGGSTVTGRIAVDTDQITSGTVIANAYQMRLAESVKDPRTPDWLQTAGLRVEVDALKTDLETASSTLADLQSTAGLALERDEAVTSAGQSYDQAAYSPGFDNSASTFRGWGSPAGAPEAFDAIRFRIDPWDGTDLPTEARVVVYDAATFAVSGGAITSTPLAEGTAAISAEEDVQQYVTVRMSERFVNSEGANLFIVFRLNGKSGNYGVASSVGPYPTPTYLASGYTTSDDPTSNAFTVGGTSRNIWFEFLDVTDRAVPTPAFMDYLRTEIGASVDPYWGRHYLRSWRAAIAEAAQNAGAAVLAILGDSNTNTGYRLPDPLRRLLGTAVGAAGCGFISATAGVAAVAPYGAWVSARTGTWTHRDITGATGIDAHEAYSTDAATPASLTFAGVAAQAPYGQFTDAVILYKTISGGGSFRYRVDGGAWTTVSTDAALGVGTVTISGLSDSAHTIQVEVTAAGSAGVTLYGLDLRRGAGVRLHKLGNSGGRASDLTAIDAGLWQGQLAALAPDLVAIAFGTNEHSMGVSPATFRANVETIISRVQTALPLADILLVAPGDNGLTGRPYAISEYRDVLLELAREEEYAYLSLQDLHGDYAGADARGLMLADGSTVHWSERGGRANAAALFELLRFGF